MPSVPSVVSPHPELSQVMGNAPLKENHKKKPKGTKTKQRAKDAATNEQGIQEEASPPPSRAESPTPADSESESSAEEEQAHQSAKENLKVAQLQKEYSRTMQSLQVTSMRIAAQLAALERAASSADKTSAPENPIGSNLQVEPAPSATPRLTPADVDMPLVTTEQLERWLTQYPASHPTWHSIMNTLLSRSAVNGPQDHHPVYDLNDRKVREDMDKMFQGCSTFTGEKRKGTGCGHWSSPPKLA